MAPANRAPYLFLERADPGADKVVLQARAKPHRVQDYKGPCTSMRPDT
jgi:hypothetical protein